MKRAVCAVALAALVILTVDSDCGGGEGPPAPPSVGFIVHTMDEANLFGTLKDSPNIGVAGNFQDEIVSNPVGTFKSFSGTTDSNGYLVATGVIVPAVWKFKESNGPCGGQSTVATVGNQQTQDLDCISIVLGFGVAPSSLSTSSPPAGLSITGESISTTYGMPHVQIFDNLGTMMADLVATSVSDGGLVLASPSPIMDGWSTGTYGLEVLNVQSDGSLSPVGAAPVPIVAPWNGGGGGGKGGCGAKCTQWAPPTSGASPWVSPK